MGRPSRSAEPETPFDVAMGDFRCDIDKAAEEPSPFEEQVDQLNFFTMCAPTLRRGEQKEEKSLTKVEKKLEKTNGNPLISKQQEKKDVKMKYRVVSGGSKDGSDMNWSSEETHAECLTRNENTKETYGAPQHDSELFSDETCANGETTPNDGRDSLDSVVPGWRRGLVMHPSTKMGWGGPLETRDRGASDDDESAESASWGGSLVIRELLKVN